jgi:hypothetical protein
MDWRHVDSEACVSGIHFPGRSALQQVNDEAELILCELDNAKWPLEIPKTKWPLDNGEIRRLQEISAFYTYPKAQALQYVVNPLDLRLADSNDLALRASTIADLHTMFSLSHRM